MIYDKHKFLMVFLLIFFAFIASRPMLPRSAIVDSNDDFVIVSENELHYLKWPSVWHSGVRLWLDPHRILSRDFTRHRLRRSSNSVFVRIHLFTNDTED